MKEKNIMYNFTNEDHRKRLNNIRFIEKTAEKVQRKHLIAHYIQGQFVWPSNRFDESRDEDILKLVAENGVGLIQLWEKVSRKDHREGEHPDLWEMHLGQKMYRPYSKEECEKFIKTAHKYGLKVLPYTSTNFYRIAGSDFNPAWALPREADLCEVLAHCSAASPGWRERIIRQYAEILDEYEFDGIYIDAGYVRPSDYMRLEPYYLPEQKLCEDEVLAFDESASHDGAMEDMLALIYDEVKTRGGVLKLHKEGIDTIHSDMKLYDYLWVGEAVESIDYIREKTKNYRPYVVPDYNFELKDDDERYLNTIPFMQFPVVRNGTMGIGSYEAACPDFERQLKWLKIYKELTSIGTWCYMDIDCEALVTAKGKNTVLTAYVNRDIYVVVANFGNTDDEIRFADKVSEIKPEGNGKIIDGQTTLPARKMRVFRFEENTAVGENIGVKRNISKNLMAD